jgi:pyruvate dehydrogenase (quinone)
MRVARIEPIGDASAGLHEHGLLAPDRPFPGEAPVVEEKAFGELIGSALVESGAARRREMLGERVAEVGLGRAHVLPVGFRLDADPFDGEELALDAQQLLDDALGLLVASLDEALVAAAEILNAAERVTILAGAGCQGAHEEVIALADALKAPIVHSLRGKEFVEYDNPYDVGMTGLLGFTSGYRAMEHCDALLMLGTDFPYRPFFPENAPVVQVDVRGEHIGRRIPVEVGLLGTVKDTIPALLGHLDGDRDATHLARMRSHYRRTRERLDALAGGHGDRASIHPQTLTSAIDRLAAEDAVFLADVGTPVVWAARYLTMNGRRRLIGSFVHGTMANAMPQAIGVRASHPGRQVVTLSGDGGLAMMLGDLITLRQQHLPVKVVVFNNGALAFVELEMKADGIVHFASDLDNPSFAEVGRAVGLHGVRIEHPSELDDGLREALAYDGAAVIEVMTDRQELSLPPGITVAQAKGFTLWATRSVLSGRADEVLEVAKTNIRELALE